MQDEMECETEFLFMVGKKKFFNKGKKNLLGLNQKSTVFAVSSSSLLLLLVESSESLYCFRRNEKEGKMPQ